MRGNANNYKRFEGIGDEEADEVEEAERAQLKHNIELLADKLCSDPRVMARSRYFKVASLLRL